jgi:iron complex outermembrane receptor protein
MGEWQMSDWRRRMTIVTVAAGLAIPGATVGAEETRPGMGDFWAQAGPGETSPAPTGAAEAEAPKVRNNESAIEEITVSARRRDENIQSTPISVVAFSEEELESRQIKSITDVGESVPNLKFDTGNGTNNSARIYIRGVGQDDGRSNVDPGVGLYIDGVYIPRLTGSVVSTVDVEQIEVLRGPQGTLFGKNTVGGVVSIRTTKPGPELDGRAVVRYGSFNSFESQGMINIPIVPEKFMARFTAETQTDDGYLRNRTRDTRTGDNKLLKGRAAFRLLPTDTISLDLSYEQTVENEKTPTPECRIGNAFAPGRFLTDSFAVGPNGEAFVSDCSLSRGDGDELTGNVNFETKSDLDTRFLVNDVSWALSDSITFKSLSSWREVSTRASSIDLDVTSVDGFGVGANKDENDTLSQEFQLTGKTLNDKLTYTTGAYWFKEQGHGNNRLSALSNVLALIRAEQTSQLRFPNGLTFDLIDQNSNGGLTDAVFGLNQSGTDRFETTSLAGFFEGTYDFTDKLSATAGVRYTAERKERQGKTLPLADASALRTQTPPGMPPRTFATRPDRTFNTLGLQVNDRFGKWTPRFQLEYQATDAVFAYASYSRGFKSGGFNTTVFSPTPRQLNGPPDESGKFDEEVLDSYEIGLKTQWFDNRLLLNFAAFYNDYEDIQLTTIQIQPDGRPQANVNNVAKAIIKGFEFDFQARPFGALQLSGGVGMTDVIYRDFVARVDTATELRRRAALPVGDPNRIAVDFNKCLSFTNCDPASFINAATFVFNPMGLPNGDFSDEDRTNTPNFNANVSVDYAFNLGSWGQLLTRLTYFVQGDVEYATFNDAGVRQSKFGLLNSRIAWELGDGKTIIGVFGRNLLDRTYLNGGFSLNDTNGVSTVFRGRPRTFGIELSRRF